MKTFTIDGNHFNNLYSFYDEVASVLCPGFSMGHSLDAFNDALVGGLSDDGIIYREPAEIVWLNSSKSKSELLNDFDEVKEMIEAHGHHLVLS